MSIKPSRLVVTVLSLAALWGLGVSFAQAGAERGSIHVAQDRKPSAVIVEPRGVAGDDLSPAVFAGDRGLQGLELWTESGRYPLDGYEEKYLLLHFWATWCAPCIVELPDLLAFMDSRDGRRAMAERDIRVLLISQDFQLSHARGFLERNNIPEFTVMLDDDRKIIRRLLDGESYQLPMTLLVQGGSGEILWRHDGPLEWRQSSRWLQDMDRDLGHGRQ
ncbi:MAG: TlpA family protein disulfide reductase [Kiloniellales bacterium]|nr:TlpA family protein disulfide reductase [Kiloniellales bacterium]